MLTVTSTSANANPNAGITYSLVSNPQNSFSINDTTGILSTTEVLDYELQTEYVLRVSARNQAYNTETSITVDVIDENDYAPYCGQPIYNFEAVATSVSGILVGNVLAIDQDVTSPNRDTFFRMRHPSHSIRVNASSVYLRSAARGFARRRNSVSAKFHILCHHRSGPWNAAKIVRLSSGRTNSRRECLCPRISTVFISGCYSIECRDRFCSYAACCQVYNVVQYFSFFCIVRINLTIFWFLLFPVLELLGVQGSVPHFSI